MLSDHSSVSTMTLMPSRCAVVLFTGDPRRESQRKNLSAGFLERLHRQLVRTVRGVRGVELIIASASTDRLLLEYEDVAISLECHPERSEGSGWPARSPAQIPRFARHDKPARSVAEQVELALRICFAEGYRSVILLAGDVAGLTCGVLDQAVETLDASEKRLVLGPSGDGGFYVAGFNRLPDVDWSALPWFTPAAAESLVAASRDSGFVTVELPRLDDVDSPEDAVRISGRIRGAAGLRDLYELLLSAPIPRGRGAAEPRPFESRSPLRRCALRGPPLPRL